MEDEAAEIELLEQNLNKTRQISQRMISILTTFDYRLNKLEKSMLPLYSATQVLTRRAENIESTLVRIDEVASDKEGVVAAEEALILRGPQPGQLQIYTDVLERLNTSVAFKVGTQDSITTARLIETGSKKLTQLYTKLVAEACTSSSQPLQQLRQSGSGSGAVNIPSAPPPFSPQIFNTLRPLVTFLRALPLPSTHPSHPAAPAILSTLKEAQRGYADMRASWARRCLDPIASAVLERAEDVNLTASGSRGEGEAGIDVGQDVGRFVWFLLGVAEKEHELLTDLLPLLPTQSTYTTLTSPLIQLFSTTLSTLTALIKRNLHRYTFLALSLYSTLLSLQPKWDEVMIRKTGGARKDNEMKEGAHVLRAVCLRSFPEFLLDVKAAAMNVPRSVGSAGAGPGGEAGTGVVDFIVSTVNYLRMIPEVQDAVGAALITLGDGNWKMGEGVSVNQAQRAKPGEGDERTLIEHYLYDVLQSTLQTLTTLSRAHKKPAMGSIFLLNNISYLRSHLLFSNPPSPKVPIASFFALPTQEMLTNAFRTAKSAYFDGNFGGVMNILGEEGIGIGGGPGGLGTAASSASNLSNPTSNTTGTTGSGITPSGGTVSNLKSLASLGVGGGGAKAATKERFVRFFEALDEVVERHRSVSVLGSSGGGISSLSYAGGGGGAGEEEEDREREKETRFLVRDEVARAVVPAFRRFVLKGMEKEFTKNPQKYIKMTPEEVDALIRKMYN